MSISTVYMYMPKFKRAEIKQDRMFVASRYILEESGYLLPGLYITNRIRISFKMADYGSKWQTFTVSRHVWRYSNGNKFKHFWNVKNQDYRDNKFDRLSNWHKRVLRTTQTTFRNVTTNINQRSTESTMSNSFNWNHYTVLNIHTKLKIVWCRRKYKKWKRQI